MRICRHSTADYAASCEECGQDLAEWQSAQTWRVMTSDGVLWCESAVKHEALDALDKIRTEAITVYLPLGVKTFGPDPDARLEHRWERHESVWRKCGVHDSCRDNPHLR